MAGIHRAPCRHVLISTYDTIYDSRSPLGLIDKDETAEQAAIRELKEETGFVASGILQSSPLLVCDPG